MFTFNLKKSDDLGCISSHKMRIYPIRRTAITDHLFLRLSLFLFGYNVVYLFVSRENK